MRQDYSNNMTEIVLLSDQEFSAFKQGNGRVFHKVFDQYYGLVKYIVKRCGVSNGDVADIVQESFFRLYQHKKALTHQAVIKSWLANTAKNLSIDFLRKHKRVSALTDEQSDKMAEQSTENDTRELEIELIGKLLKKISIETGETSAVDFYIKGLSAKQIAEINSEPISSVTNRLSRFRKKFKHRLIQHIEELRATIPD